MRTECTAGQLVFQACGRRKVVAAFDGGHVTSDGGALLLREVDDRLGVTARLAECFTDYRDPELIEHELPCLLRQRVHGIALGYEDLNDHKELMRDPLLALVAGKEDIEGKDRVRALDKGKPLASSSTLNRLELTPEDANHKSRYQKVAYHAEQIEQLLADLFLDAHPEPPEGMVLDFDATDDPLHGNQEGRFFHGYYGCYCYMPLYVTCGEHLLVAKLRPSNQDASAGALEVLIKLVERIRARWPEVRIIIRADAGFARDTIMSWCEAHTVHYLFGLAKNPRLLKQNAKAQDRAHIRHIHSGVACREFTRFSYRTHDSWSRERTVVGKAEWLAKGPNPRFVVTNLPDDYASAQDLYEKLYCARGDMENRIKEQQLDLFADRTSTGTLRANQLRLWFSTFAYVLMSALRRIGLRGTELAKATCGSIRLKLLKIGARIALSVRRIVIHLATGYPRSSLFATVLERIQRYPLRT
jgi:hypothetical protein